MAEYLDKNGLKVVLNQVKSYIDTTAENAGGGDDNTVTTGIVELTRGNLAKMKTAGYVTQFNSFTSDEIGGSAIRDMSSWPVVFGLSVLDKSSSTVIGDFLIVPYGEGDVDCTYSDYTIVVSITDECKLLVSNVSLVTTQLQCYIYKFA